MNVSVGSDEESSKSLLVLYLFKPCEAPAVEMEALILGIINNM